MGGVVDADEHPDATTGVDGGRGEAGGSGGIQRGLEAAVERLLHRVADGAGRLEIGEADCA